LQAKFQVFIGKDISEHDTFPEAVRSLFKAIENCLANGRINLNILETMCWIQGTFAQFGLGPVLCRTRMDFYRARDFAYELGLVRQTRDGVVFVEPQPTVDSDRIFRKFVYNSRDPAQI
jgi:hypothetical protein